MKSILIKDTTQEEREEIIKASLDCSGGCENAPPVGSEAAAHRSVFRNEGDFDRNLQLRIIPAVWTGLTV